MLSQYRFECVEPGRFFERADHLEAERFAQPECAFKDAAVEPADDQHRPAKALIGEEAEQFDPVHSGHAKVERDHCGAVVDISLTKIVVAIGLDRVEAAQARRIGDERGKLRFVIDQ